MFIQELHRASKDRRFNRRKLRDNPELTGKGRKSSARIIVICSCCKKLRGRDGDWHPLNRLKVENADLQFSHGICPACAKALYPDAYEAIRRKRACS